MAAKLNKSLAVQFFLKRGRIFILFLGALITVGGIYIGKLLFGDEIWINAFMEILSILVTILIIDVLNRWRDEQQTRRENIARLLREARSTVDYVAAAAMEELHDSGLLTGEDSIYAQKVREGDENAHLRRAALTNIHLNNVNLAGVDMRHITLNKADLSATNLSGADLTQAKLQQVNLTNANLQGANFTKAYCYRANFSGADLRKADFRGANLEGAELKGAKLDNDTKFDSETVLPDAVIRGEIYSKYWNGNTNMEQYIAPSEA